MATIDEELRALERDIRTLKIEYDQFFGGGRKRPPSEIEWRIELVIKKYGERGGEMKFNQRFRFTNLSQTYAKYKDIFRKRMKQKEEGATQRHFGAAASGTAAGSGGAFRMTCSEPEREQDKVEQLYAAFLTAKKQAGEETSRLSRENFKEFVKKKTRDLQKQKNCRDVEYVVEVVGGQVKLKALVKA